MGNTDTRAVADRTTCLGLTKSWTAEESPMSRGHSANTSIAFEDGTRSLAVGCMNRLPWLRAAEKSFVVVVDQDDQVEEDGAEQQQPSTPMHEGARDHHVDDDDDLDDPSPCSMYWRSTSSTASSDNSATPPMMSDNKRTPSWLSLNSYYNGMDYTADEMLLGEDATPASDLSRPRPTWIVTTAALPWYTGTAINPLLRAAYLVRKYHDNAAAAAPVTLVVPWLESANDRVALYGADWQDATPARQEQYMRDWLQQHAGLLREAMLLRINFYPARYHAALCSIFAMGDLCEQLHVPANAVCVLEEPEHLSFYRAPNKTGWRQKFAHVVGVIHTNYRAYASAQKLSGLVLAPVVGVLSAWFVRAYCDKVIKLSDVLQVYAMEKEVVSNVHGIRPDFLQKPPPVARKTGGKVYFVGKLLWAKGLDKMLELQGVYRRTTGAYFTLDIYGSGPEEDEIRKAFLRGGGGGGALESSANDDTDVQQRPSSFYNWATKQAMPVKFLGRRDHAALSSDYRIFVNPSITEVLCTTTAEAIGLGRFVIVPQHPSNSFFAQFPNCLQYTRKSGFVRHLQYALTHSPVPLSDEWRHVLTWEAATDRLIAAAAVSHRDAARRERVARKRDERIADWHYEFGNGLSGDVIRKVMGGGPVADQYRYQQRRRLWSDQASSSSPSSGSASPHGVDPAVACS